jgi:hypothetical protein
MRRLRVWCVGEGTSKNIVFLSKNAVRNSRVMIAATQGMARFSTREADPLLNIVFLGKRILCS